MAIIALIKIFQQVVHIYDATLTIIVKLIFNYFTITLIRSETSSGSVKRITGTK